MSTLDAQVQHLLAGAEPFARDLQQHRQLGVGVRGPDMRATIRRTPATFSAICTAVAREAVRTFRMYGDIRGP
jgi:hypothetical protein